MTAAYDVLIVGGGMAGWRLQQTLRRLGFAGRVGLVSGEQNLGYNRVLLPRYLSGRCDDSALLQERENSAKSDALCGRQVVSIDLPRREAVLDDGAVLGFANLVFATGSTVPMPEVAGRDLSGVVTFRSLQDADQIKRLVQLGGRAVVVGGGALGLEAADALNALGVRVTVATRGSRLMAGALDQAASDFLARRLKGLGIEVRFKTTVLSVQGEQSVTGVRFSDNAECAAQLVLFAVGARPNVALALAAGVPCDRGVVVDDALASTVDGVYAIGECAQVAGAHHQLVAAVHAQADALATTLAQQRTGVTIPAQSVRLKVDAAPVVAMGDMQSALKNAADLIVQGREVYRRLRFDGRTLIGAVLCGDVRGANSVLASIGQTLEDVAAEQLIFAGGANV